MYTHTYIWFIGVEPVGPGVSESTEAVKPSSSAAKRAGPRTISLSLSPSLSLSLSIYIYIEREIGIIIITDYNRTYMI